MFSKRIITLAVLALGYSALNASCGGSGADMSSADSTEIKKDSVVSSGMTIEDQRLAYLRKQFPTYPKMKFPFHTKVQGQRTGGYSTDGDASNLLFDNQIASIAGTIADTSNCFGIFYYVHSDDIMLSFVAIDKQGKILEQTSLGESCFHGEGGDCATHIDVTKDLQITSDYSEFSFPGDEETGWADVPNDAHGYVKVSQISPSGKLKLVSNTQKDPAIILKNPIIHDGK